MNSKWLLAGCALACTCALAQAAPPNVGKVDGVVTSSRGGNAGLAASGTALPDGTRLVTTSNSSATIRGDGGCSVRVPPGHAVTVRKDMNCQQLKAGVAPVIPEQAARSPNAPPAHVLERLTANGASPVAIGVHQQLADDPPLSAR
jgi:phage tail protein X